MMRRDSSGHQQGTDPHASSPSPSTTPSLTSSPSTSSTQGQPQYGVDMTQTLKNLDILIKECNTFINDMKSLQAAQLAESKSIRFNGPAVQKFRQWRSKKRDEKLLHQYHSIIPRIRDGEEYLRELIIQVVEKKLALRDQARHLKARLDACILHNGSYVEQHGGVIDTMRSTVNALSNESALLKGMVAFNSELVRQKIIQNIKAGRSFVSWGSRAVLLRPISEQELNEDEEHPVLMSRLNALRLAKEGLVVKLASLLETRELHLMNFENCSRTSQKLVELLRAAGDDIQILQLQHFDHELCHDCSYVQAMTVECSNHLNVLTDQATEASQRLIALVELRERVRESGEFLIEDEASGLEEIPSFSTKSSSFSGSPASTKSSPVKAFDHGGTAGGLGQKSGSFSITMETST